MSRTRSGLGIWVVGIIGLGVVVLLVIGVASLYFNGNRPFTSPPSITILSPQDDVVIRSGEGIVVNVVAESDSGISSIEYFLNDQLLGQSYSPDQEATQFQTQISWISSVPGINKISVVAYGVNGAASDPADLLVGVISSTSQQNIPDLDEISSIPNPNAGENLEPQNGSQVEISQGSQDIGIVPLDSPGENDPARQEALDLIFDLGNQLSRLGEVNFPVEIASLLNNSPPVISILDATYNNLGNEGVLHAGGIAEDNVAVIQVDLVIHNAHTDYQETTTILCPETPTCEFYYSFHVEDGLWNIYARSLDSSGLYSNIAVHQLQLLPGEEGQLPAFADEGEEIIPVEHCLPPDQDLISPVPMIIPVDDILDVECLDDQEGVEEIVDPSELYRSRCLFLEGWLGLGGDQIQLKLTNNCQVENEEGSAYRFIIHKSDELGNDLPFIPPISERTYESIESEISINIFDGDIVCGMVYNYNINLQKETPDGMPIDADFTEDIGIAKTTVLVPPCFEDSVATGSIQMEAALEQAFGELWDYRVTWHIPQLDEWSDGFQSNSINWQLWTYETETRQFHESRYSGSFAPGELPWIHEVIATAYPSEPVVFVLRLINSETGLIIKQIMAKPTYPELFATTSNSFKNWEIISYPIWKEQSDGSYQYRTIFKIKLPPLTPFPSDTLAKSVFLTFHSNSFETNPIELQYNGHMAHNGHLFEIETPVVFCGDPEFFVRLEEIQPPNSNIVITPARGRAHWVIPSPCLPPPPDIFKIGAFIDEGNSLVDIYWREGYQHPLIDYFSTQGYFLNITVNGESELILLDGNYGSLAIPAEVSEILQLELFAAHDGLYSTGTTIMFQTPANTPWDCIIENPSTTTINTCE